MLSWVVSESYRNKGLNILRGMPRPTPQMVVMPAETQLSPLKCHHLPGAEGRSGVLLASIGLAMAVLPVTVGGLIDIILWPHKLMLSYAAAGGGRPRSCMQPQEEDSYYLGLPKTGNDIRLTAQVSV